MATSRLASNAARFASYAARAAAQQAISAARSSASLSFDAARENARINSYPQSIAAGAILTGVDVGGVGHAKITVADHDRIYPVQGDLAVPTAHLVGIADVTTLDDGVTLITSALQVFLYYDDLTLADATPVVMATTDVQKAQAGAAPGRHFLGAATTPAMGDPPTQGTGGYPPGFSNSV